MGVFLMKTSINKVILGSTTLLAIGATAHQAQAATGAVGIDAIILSPITVTPQINLDFGILTDGGAGGTATVDTADTLTGTTGATSGAGGTIASGTFDIAGSIGNQINITTPATVNIADGGNTMAVHSFAILAPAAGGGGNDTGTAAAGANLASTLTAGSGGTAAGYSLGATLVVGAAQAAGTYAGTVTITAVYN